MTSSRLLAGLVAGLVLAGGCTSGPDDRAQPGSVTTTSSTSGRPSTLKVGESVRTADWEVALVGVVDPWVDSAWPADADGFNEPALPPPGPGEQYVRIDVRATNTRNAPQVFPDTNVQIEDAAGDRWGAEGADAPWDGPTFPPVVAGGSTTHRYFFLVRKDDRRLGITFEPIRLTGPQVRFPIR